MTADDWLFAIKEDTHSPEKYRINGALSNSADFSEVFACSVGSKMNKANKCRYW